MKTIHQGYCDKYELAQANQPTIFNSHFWHGDGSPAIAVKLVVSDDSAAAVKRIRTQAKRAASSQK